MLIELNFEKINKTEKFDRKTSKLWPVNLLETETCLEILPVYTKERLTLYKIFNVSSFCLNPTTRWTNVNLSCFSDSIEIASLEGLTLCCPETNQSKQPLAC